MQLNTNTNLIETKSGVCVCVCVCVRACVRACVRVCVYVSVYTDVEFRLAVYTLMVLPYEFCSLIFCQCDGPTAQLKYV